MAKSQFKIAIIRAAIVLVPSYMMAYLTDKMVYVVPTLAAASFIAATLNIANEDSTVRIDEDGGDTAGFDPTDIDGTS